MPLSTYLPSAQFTTIVLSIALAGGLVIAADYITSPKGDGGAIIASDTAGIEPMDWKGSLAAIQGESVLPEPVSPATLASLHAEAATDSVTGTVGRSLLLNLAEAKSQGLGSDFPTQERLVAQAMTQAEVTRGNPTYTEGDLLVIPEDAISLRAYGNAIASITQKYPKTSREATLIAFGEGVGKNSKGLDSLIGIEAEFRAMTTEFLRTPVPLTLQPIHLQIVNNLARITSLYTDFRAVQVDPLRTINAMKLHQSLILETQRLLINVAGILNEGGILFTSDEPGKIWSLLLTSDSNL